VQVDLEAAKNGVIGLPRAQLPALLPVLRKGWVFILPIAVLVHTLVFRAWEPGRAAIAAVIVAIPAGIIRRETRPTLRKLLDAMVETGQSALELVAITAVAGIVIGSLQLSGLTFGLSLIMVTFAQGNLLLLLGLSAVLCIILGMGMPTAVIYILLAVLVAPTLVEFGINPLAAHLFLFYFGMLSMITPPMCLATFAAATIARCNFWQAGWAGTRLGVVAYIIPFFFVFHPELLMIGRPVDIVVTALSALVGIMFVAASCAGYQFAPIGMVNRVILFAAGLCLIPSPLESTLWFGVNLGGLAAGVAVMLWQYRTAARDRDIISVREG